MLNHLVENSRIGIENNLLWVRKVRENIFAFWFNISIFIIVIGSFTYFLYASYGTASKSIEDIPFEPRVWNNAVRNVPITQYGQFPQIETRDGVQGRDTRTSAVAF